MNQNGKPEPGVLGRGVSFALPHVSQAHRRGAESRESALKRLEQALADDDFSGFSEHVLRAIGHDTAPPLADGVDHTSL